MSDNVNNPKHYSRLSPQPIDLINDWGLNFNLGNAVKYIARAGHKTDAIEDLQKAIFYINYEISRMAYGKKPEEKKQ